MDQNGFRASELGSDEIGRYLCVPNSPIVLEGFEDNVDMLLCSELSYFLSQIFYDFANLEVYRFVIRYFDIQSFLERDLLCEKYSVDVSNIFPGNILSDTITETFGLINPINEKHRKKLLTVVADFSLPKDIDKINDVVYSLTCDFLDNEPLVGNVNFEIKTFLGGSNATKKYPCWGIQGAGVFVFREFTDDDACTIEEKISTKIHGLLSDIIEFINIMVGISYSIPDGLKGILLDWEENTDTIDITFCIKVFARLHNNSTLPGKEKEKIYKITQMLLYLRLFYDSKDNGDGDGDYVNGSMPETLSVVRFSVIGSLVTGIGKYAGDMLATREVVISNLSGLSLKDRVFVSYSHSKVRSRIYAIEDVEKSKILEKIALSKSNLFIAQDCIQKEKLFKETRNYLVIISIFGGNSKICVSYLSISQLGEIFCCF